MWLVGSHKCSHSKAADEACEGEKQDSNDRNHARLRTFVVGCSLSGQWCAYVFVALF